MADLGKFSLNGAKSIASSNSFINIFEGAVRSSKTVAANYRFAQHVRRSKQKHFLATGKSLGSLERNVINHEFGLMHFLAGYGTTYRRSGEGGASIILNIDGIPKTIYCMGANDKRAETVIRGMTIDGWLADEITLYEEEFVNQAKNRLSYEESKAFWTCNPDTPFHYVKKDYIDSKDGDYRSFHFTLDDNLHLPEKVKERIKKENVGVYFKRNVLGLWVIADGLIYQAFNPQTMVIDTLPNKADLWEIGIGVDYGTSNATAFILALTDGKYIYLTNEYYGTTQKSPSQYAEDYVNYKNEIPYSFVKTYLDPAAAGFQQELLNKGYYTIHADNDVLGGIGFVASLFAMDRIRIHSSCKHLLKELSTYAWDTKAALLTGKDKPIKVNDHLMDATRYVLYSNKGMIDKMFR